MKPDGPWRSVGGLTIPINPVRWDCKKILKIVDQRVSEDGNGWYTFSGKVVTIDPNDDQLLVVFQLVCASTSATKGPLTEIIGCHVVTDYEGNFQFVEQFKEKDGEFYFDGIVTLYILDTATNCAISEGALILIKGSSADPPQRKKRK